MGKGFYVSKLVLAVGIIFAVAAVSTIIALAVVYSQEKGKNNDVAKPPETTTSSSGTSTATTTTTATATATATTAQSNDPWNKYRLPKTLSPVHYDVELQPFLVKNADGLYVFRGKSTAFFICNDATDLIIIHSNKLNHTKFNSFDAKLQDGATDVALKSTFFQKDKQFLVVQAAANLVPGKQYGLYTEFVGELADDLAGFYRSEYLEDGVTKIIATTQMQAPDARKAFPCFDEPAMKATFNITLKYRQPYKAMSNMREIDRSTVTEDGQQWTVSKFDKTPKMSSYLVAFIVSEFEAVGDPGNATVTGVQIWGRKKAIQDENQGEYALSVTKPILDFFAEYYRTPYPLPKSDQVALPDFSAGAMENWGLVTYRETALLFDDQVSSIGNKERVVTVIAHELAHQWFGNLVTIRWWNDLWLNEGFASYVEYLGADKAEPNWNIKDLIVLNDVHRVMAVDALASSHPLTSREDEVNSPSEISALFDSIAYSKGASVIRMLSEFLTEPLFVDGLASYLKGFEYSNTVYSDLWTHLQWAVNNQTAVKLPLPIKDIMDTWVLQMGFPVVKIDTATGVVTQKHFLLDPDSVVTRPSPFDYKWKVPISYKISSKEDNIWLQNESETVEDFKITGNDWLLVNLNVTGYYRVNYDDNNWSRLLNQLQTSHQAIPVINRAQIIDDAFNLARAKQITTIQALDTTKYISADREYMPWQAALSGLSYFTQMFDRTEVFGPMKKYMKMQVNPLFEYFKQETGNWTNRPVSLTDQYCEINTLSTACSYDIEDCLKFASELFSQWMATPQQNNIHPNLRTNVYCTAVAQGGEQEWNFVWDRFQLTDIAQEQDKLRAALACSKEPWILNRFLEYSLDPTMIRRQDAVSTISSVVNNPIGQSLAWDFVRAKWKTLYSMFGESSFSFGNLIERVTRRFSTEFELQQLLQFKADNQNPGFGTASQALEQAIEKTKANINWVNQNKAAVKKWFEDAVVP
ncbi:hypothetical protein XENTR_v10009290 [Xenopus tropicalis]|uniref:Aminopeptidase n=1 Tax=Xenopus tropicalis TaxID=8364 RepID=A0A6I8Q201_XENTR|nr:aminopeptidase N [Xenopus tropicalis]XP_031755082.1 aminopeptidase N [Xenopus tropicalis]KAE8618156.1 hypothetical protein XENTR_v10009290 [Xenopus tropicalis]KAE8618157.1 hypothetical protein XENTR_v10009290 [Xenopus tropicalis]KAE8618158.1 hypothetical protein XENTR_v10009290 [Xenopus tropicalis]KAE8618159.1 hypothetical protein XENTR_v10009290 [Xenopus tropicalis]